MDDRLRIVILINSQQAEDGSWTAEPSSLAETVQAAVHEAARLMVVLRLEDALSFIRQTLHRQGAAHADMASGVAAVLLPLIDDYSFARHLNTLRTRLADVSPEVPVIGLTRGEGARALALGAFDYVPMDEAGFEATLRARVITCVQLYELRTQVIESERRFRTLIHRNADGILVIDSDEIVRFCNPAAEVLFDQPAEQLIGQKFGFPLQVGENTEIEIYHPHTGETLVAEMRVVEIEWTSVDLPYHASGDASMETSEIAKSQRAHLASLRDITARKLLEAERVERERIGVALEKEREMRELKDRFLSMMSHELRTPLALIQLSYDMMKQYGARATEEEKQQYLDNIHVQVQHLTEMVQDVMTISRADRADQEFDPEITDMITYCRAVVEEFQLNYHKSHAIDFECPHTFVRASVDRRLLRQALTNLLSNAIKYSPPGAAVHVQLYAQGKDTVIKVIDSGIGIPAEDQPRLFEAFHRGTNVDTIPGTGLGLTIVAQAVKAHKGSVHVESDIGKGSTFILRLPVLIAAG